MLTPKQIRVYRGEWAKAVIAMQRFGRCLTKAETEAERKAIHRQIGASDSSKDFTNRDLDRFLALCYSWSLDSDIGAQARQIEQPVARCRWLVDALFDQIEANLDSLDRTAEADPIRRGKPRDGYLLSMLRRMSARESRKLFLDDFSETAWNKVIQSLHYRYDQVSRKTADPAARGRGGKRRRPYDLPNARNRAITRHDRNLTEAPVDDDADPF